MKYIDMNSLLKGLTAIAIIALIFFLNAQTSHVKNTATTSNTISFIGEGEVTSKPDIAQVTLSMLTEAETSKKAQDDNTERSNAVVKYLKGKGIDEKDIKTSGYNIMPLYQYPSRQLADTTEPRIYGYQVSQNIIVKIRKLDDVSDILDGVVEAGVNQVYGLSFSIDEPDELEKQARDIAIKDAKDKAKELEKALGIKLGNMVNYNEGGSGYRAINDLSYGISKSTTESSVPAIPTGENEVKVTVTLTYQIK